MLLLKKKRKKEENVKRVVGILALKRETVQQRNVFSLLMHSHAHKGISFNFNTYQNQSIRTKSHVRNNAYLINHYAIK